MLKRQPGKIRASLRSGDVLFSFLTITTLFATLLLLCFVPGYFYFYNYVTDVTIDSYQERLETGVAQLDNTFATLNNAVQATVKDSRFRVFQYNNPAAEFSPLLLPNMSTMLRNLLFSDELIADAGILFSTDTAITCRQSFHGSQYYSLYPSFLSCENLTAGEWRTALEECQPLMAEQRYHLTSTTAIGQNEIDALTWSSYWTNGDYYTKSLFYALLPTENLLNCLTNVEVLEGGSVQILDARGNALLSRMGDEAGNVLFISTTTANHSLRITIGVPRSIIYEQMEPFRRIVLCYVVGTVFFALLLSFLFANRLSRPLRRLKAMVLGVRHPGTGFPQEDARPFRTYARQFDQLSRSIAGITRQMEEYEFTIRAQRDSMCAQMLDKALHRGLQDSEAFYHLFPSFPRQYRLCMLHCSPSPDGAIERTVQLQAHIAAVVHRQLPNVIVHPTDGDALALILPCDQENDVLPDLHLLQNHLTRLTDQPIHCAISDVFEDVGQLLDAYQQAQFLHAAFTDRDMLYPEQMKDLPPQKRLLPLSYAKLNSLYTALYAGNIHSILYILDECMEGMRDADASLQQHVCSQLSDLIAHVRLENPVLLCELSVPAFDRGMRLPEDFVPAFKTVVGKLCMEREDQSMLFAQQIISYINEHLCDPDLYLQSALSHFRISAPTLQKMVRLATGQTFASYIEEKRLELALSMIVETDLLLQEIARRCGFASTNTFYKSFRRKYGKAPQDFRKTDP